MARLTLLFCVFSLGWINTCFADLSVVQSVTNAPVASQTSYSLAYGQSVTAGNLLVVVVDGYQIPASASIADSQGNAYQAADTMYTDPASDARVWSQVFWATAKASGANTVTATFSSATYPGMALYEVAAPTPGSTWSVAAKQGTNSGGGTGTLTVGAVTTSGASAFVLSYIGSANGTVTGGPNWSFTPGVSFDLGSIEGATEYQIGPAGTYTGTFGDTAANGFSGGVVAFQASSGGGGGGSANAPLLLDYARCLVFCAANGTNCAGEDNTPQSPTTQNAAYAFLADRLSFSEDTTENSYVDLSNNTAKEQFLLTNPSMQFWQYDMNNYVQNTPCSGTPKFLSTCIPTWANSEAYFLHQGGGDAAHRIVTTGGSPGAGYLLWNVGNPTACQAMNDQLVTYTATYDNRWLWLDNHSKNLSDGFVAPNGADEYPGLTSRDLDRAYQADLRTCTSTLHSALASQGRGTIINSGQASTCTSDINSLGSCGGVDFAGELTAAPGMGMVTEKAWSPYNIQDLGQWLSLIQGVVANGGFVDTLADQQPGGYGALITQFSDVGTNYGSAAERIIMWRLAAYFLVKNAGVYFNTNFDTGISTFTQNAPTGQWWPAYGYAGLGAPSVPVSSVDQPVSRVYHRPFENGDVYVRSLFLNFTFDGSTAVTLTLPRSQKLLRGDGTFSACGSQLTLRNGEAAILTNC